VRALRTLSYLLGEGLRGTWRNGMMSLASISTLAIALTVLGIFLVLAANLAHMAQLLEEQVEIVAYAWEDFDRRERVELVRKIHQIPGVSAVSFVTKEEALTRLREQFGDQAVLLEAVEQDNPLRDSVEIRVGDSARIDRIAEQVAMLDDIEDVSFKREMIQRLYTLTGAVRTGGLILVGLLALATFLVVANTIRVTVYARRREIEIMRLVGATDAFIRGPFLVEGALLGAFGAAIAAGVVGGAYTYLLRDIALALPFLPVLPQYPLAFNLAKLLVGMGLFIGLLASWFSVSRYLTV